MSGGEGEDRGGNAQGKKVLSPTMGGTKEYLLYSLLKAPVTKNRWGI